MGERSTDLLEHLFEAYLTVSDKNFTSYVQQLRTDYDTGREDITVEQLLRRGETHFQILQERGEWKAKTSEQEEIIALKAQIETIKTRPKTRYSQGDRDATQRQGRGSRRNRVYEGKWSWRNDKPGTGDPLTKTFEDVEWHYCTKHRWCQHKASACRSTRSNQPPSEASVPEIEASLANVGIEDVMEGSDEE